MAVTALKAKPYKATEAQQLAEWLARGKTEIFSVVTEVTPDLARLLLANNADNRPVNLQAVQDYAAAMVRGEWMINGQSIIVTDSGEMNDGQHRTQAVIVADQPVMMSIMFGVRRESRATLDVGRKRTLADHLAMAGHPNAAQLAATARLAWCYGNGVYSFSKAPTVEQAFDFIAANPDVQRYFYPARMIGTQFQTSGSQFSFAAFVCSRKSHNIADELLTRIQDGIGIHTSSDPAASETESGHGKPGVSAATP